jgi:membrane protease YdiL (CAAX protease family)
MKKKVVKSKKSEKKTIDFKKISNVIGMLAWVGFAVIASQFIVGYPMLWILGKPTFSLPIWTTVYSMLVYVVTAFLVVIFPKFIKDKWATKKEELGLIELPTFTDIGIAILGFVATILISGIALMILQSMHLVDGGQAQNVGYSHLNTGFDRAIAFLALVVVTPFFEELIFRGWLYDKLKKKVPVKAAIILVSILFGALHGQWNVGITVGIMSVIMCIERELTGTIYAGILTHMIKNGVAFGLLIMTGMM